MNVIGVESQVRSARVETSGVQGEALRLDYALRRTGSAGRDGIRQAFRKLIAMFEFYATLLVDPSAAASGSEQLRKRVDRDRQYIVDNFDMPTLQALASAFWRNNEATQEYFWTFQRMDKSGVSVQGKNLDPVTTNDPRIKQLVAEGYAEFFTPANAQSQDPAFGREVLIQRDTFGATPPAMRVRRCTKVDGEDRCSVENEALNGPFTVPQQESAVPIDAKRAFDEKELASFFNLFFTAETSIVDFRGGQFNIEQQRELVDQQLQSFRALEENLDAYLDFQNAIAASLTLPTNAHTGIWRLYSVDRARMRRRGMKDRTTWRLLLRVDLHVEDVREFYHRMDGSAIEMGVNALAATHGFDRDRYRTLRYAINRSDGDRAALAALNRRIQQYIEFRVRQRAELLLAPVPYVLDPVLLPRKESSALIGHALSAKLNVQRLALASTTLVALQARERTLARELGALREQSQVADIEESEKKQLGRRITKLEATRDLVADRRQRLRNDVLEFAREEKRISAESAALREYLRNEAPSNVWIDDVLRRAYLDAVAQKFSNTKVDTVDELTAKIRELLASKQLLPSDQQFEALSTKVLAESRESLLDELAANLADALFVLAADLPLRRANPKALPLLTTAEARDLVAQPALRLGAALSDALAHYDAERQQFVAAFVPFRSWKEVGERLEQTLFFEARQFSADALLDTSRQTLREAAERLAIDLGDDRQTQQAIRRRDASVKRLSDEGQDARAVDEARREGNEEIARLRRERVDRLIEEAEQLVRNVQLEFFDRLPAAAETKPTEKQAKKQLASFRNPDDPFYGLFVNLYLEYNVKYVAERDRSLDFLVDTGPHSRALFFELAKHAQVVNEMYVHLAGKSSRTAKHFASFVRALRQQKRVAGISANSKDKRQLFDMATVLHAIESPVTSSVIDQSALQRIRSIVNSALNATKRRRGQLTPLVTAREGYTEFEMVRFSLDDGAYLVQQFSTRDAQYRLRGVFQLYIVDKQIADVKELESSGARRILLQNASLSLPKSVLLHVKPDWTRSLLLPTYTATMRSFEEKFIEGVAVRWYFIPAMSIGKFYSAFSGGKGSAQSDRIKYRHLRNLTPVWNSAQSLLVQDNGNKQPSTTRRLDSLRVARLSGEAGGLYFCVEETTEQTFRSERSWLPLYDIGRSAVVRNRRSDAAVLREPLLPSNLIGVFELRVGSEAQRIECPFGSDTLIDARPFIATDENDIVVSLEWFKRNQDNEWFLVKSSDSMAALSTAERSQVSRKRPLERVESDKRFAEFSYLYLMNVDAEDEGQYRCRVQLELRSSADTTPLPEPIQFELIFTLELSDSEFECVRCGQDVNAQNNGPYACQWHTHPSQLDSFEEHETRDTKTYNFDEFFRRYYNSGDGARKEKIVAFVHSLFSFRIEKRSPGKQSSFNELSALLRRVPLATLFRRLPELDPHSETLARYTSVVLDKLHALAQWMSKARLELPSSAKISRSRNSERYHHYVEHELTRTAFDTNIRHALRCIVKKKKMRDEYGIDDLLDDFFTLRTVEQMTALSVEQQCNINATGGKLELTNRDYVQSARKRSAAAFDNYPVLGSQRGPRSAYGLRATPLSRAVTRESEALGDTRQKNDQLWQWRCCNQQHCHPGCWRGRHSRTLRDPDLADATSTLDSETLAHYNRQVAAQASSRGTVKIARANLLLSDNCLKPNSVIFLHDDRTIRARPGSLWLFSRHKQDATQRYYQRVLKPRVDRFARTPSSEHAVYDVLSKEAVFNRLLGGRVQFPWQSFLVYMRHCDKEGKLRFEPFKMRLLESSVFDEFRHTNSGVSPENLLDIVQRFMDGEWAASDALLPTSDEEVRLLDDIKIIVFDLYNNHFAVAQKLLQPPSEFRAQLLAAAATRKPATLLPFLLMKHTHAENRSGVVDIHWQYNLPRFSVWRYDQLAAVSGEANDKAPSFAARFAVPEERAVHDSMVRRVAQASKAVAHIYRIEQNKLEAVADLQQARKQLQLVFGKRPLPPQTSRESEALLRWIADVRRRRDTNLPQQQYDERIENIQRRVGELKESADREVQAVLELLQNSALDSSKLLQAAARLAQTFSDTLKKLRTDSEAIVSEQREFEGFLSRFDADIRQFAAAPSKSARQAAYNDTRHQIMIGALDQRIADIDTFFASYLEPTSFLDAFSNALQEDRELVREQDREARARLQKQQAVITNLEREIGQRIAALLNDEEKRQNIEAHTLQHHLYEMALLGDDVSGELTKQMRVLVERDGEQPRRLYRFFLTRLLAPRQQAVSVEMIAATVLGDENAQPALLELLEFVSRYSDDQWKSALRRSVSPLNTPLDASFVNKRSLYTSVANPATLQRAVVQYTELLNSDQSAEFLERVLSRLVIASSERLQDARKLARLTVQQLEKEIADAIERVVREFRDSLQSATTAFVEAFVARLQNPALYRLEGVEDPAVRGVVKNTEEQRVFAANALKDAQAQLERVQTEQSFVSARQQKPDEFKVLDSELREIVEELQSADSELQRLVTEPIVPETLVAPTIDTLQLFPALSTVLWQSLQIQQSIDGKLAMRRRQLQSIDKEREMFTSRVNVLIGELLLLSGEKLLEAVRGRFPAVSQELDFQRYKLLRQFASQLNEDDDNRERMEESSAEQERIESRLRQLTSSAGGGEQERQALRSFLSERVPQFNSALQRAFTQISIPLLIDNLKRRAPPLNQQNRKLLSQLQSQAVEVDLLLSKEASSANILTRAFSTFDRVKSTATNASELERALRDTLESGAERIEALPRLFNVFASQQTELTVPQNTTVTFLRALLKRLPQESDFDAFCRLYVEQIGADLLKRSGIDGDVPLDRRLALGSTVARAEPFVAANMAYEKLALITTQQFPFLISDAPIRTQSGETIAKQMLNSASRISVRDEMTSEFNAILRNQLFKYQALLNQLYRQFSVQSDAENLLSYGPVAKERVGALPFLETEERDRVLPGNLLLFNQFLQLDREDAFQSPLVRATVKTELRAEIDRVEGFKNLPQFRKTRERVANYIWPPGTERGRVVTVAGKHLYDALAHFDQRLFSPTAVEEDHTSLLETPLFTLLTILVHCSLREHLEKRQDLVDSNIRTGDYQRNFNQKLRVAPLYRYRSNGSGNKALTDIAEVFDAIRVGVGLQSALPSYQQQCEFLLDALDAYWALKRTRDDFTDLLFALREKDAVRNYRDTHESDAVVFAELERQGNDASRAELLFEDRVGGDVSYAKQVALETVAFLAFFEGQHVESPLFKDSGASSIDVLQRGAAVLSTVANLSASYTPPQFADAPQRGRFFTILETRSLAVDLLNFYYAQRTNNATAKLFFLQPLRIGKKDDGIGAMAFYHRSRNLKMDTLDLQELDTLFAFTLVSAEQVDEAQGNNVTLAQRFERVLDYFADVLQLNRFLISEQGGKRWSIVQRTADNQWTLIEQSGRRIQQSRVGKLLEDVSSSLATPGDRAQLVLQRQLMLELLTLAQQRVRDGNEFRERRERYLERRLDAVQRTETGDERNLQNALFRSAAEQYRQLALLGTNNAELELELERLSPPLRHIYEPYYRLELWTAQFQLYARQARTVDLIDAEALRLLNIDRERLQRNVFIAERNLYDAYRFSPRRATQELLSQDISGDNAIYTMLRRAALKFVLGADQWQSTDKLLRFVLAEESKDDERSVFIEDVEKVRETAEQSADKTVQLIVSIQRLYDTFERYLHRHLDAVTKSSAPRISAVQPFVFPRLYNDARVEKGDQEELALLNVERVKQQVTGNALELSRGARELADRLFLLQKLATAERRALRYEQATLSRFWTLYTQRVPIDPVSGDTEAQRADSLTPFSTYSTLLDFDAASAIIRQKQLQSPGIIEFFTALVRNLFTVVPERQLLTEQQTTVAKLLQNAIDVYEKQPDGGLLRQSPIEGLRNETVTAYQIVKSLYNASLASLSRLTSAKVDMVLNPDQLDPDKPEKILFDGNRSEEVQANDVSKTHLTRSTENDTHYAQLASVLLGTVEVAGLGRFEIDTLLPGEPLPVVGGRATLLEVDRAPPEQLYYQMVLRELAPETRAADASIGASLNRRHSDTIGTVPVSFIRAMDRWALLRARRLFATALLQSSVEQLQREEFEDIVLRRDTKLWIEKLREHTQPANRVFNRVRVERGDRSVKELRGVPLILALHIVDGEDELKYGNRLLQQSFLALQRVPLFLQRYVSQFELLALVAAEIPKDLEKNGDSAAIVSSLVSNGKQSVLDTPPVLLEHCAEKDERGTSASTTLAALVSARSVVPCKKTGEEKMPQHPLLYKTRKQTLQSYAAMNQCIEFY